MGKALQRYVASGAFERELGAALAELRAERKSLEAEKSTTKRWWAERKGRTDRAHGQITKVVAAVVTLEQEDAPGRRQPVGRWNGLGIEEQH